jgi:hypothetical protein
MGAAIAIFTAVSQLLPMVLSDIQLGKDILAVFKAKGVDVDAAVSKAMADADVIGKKLLAS